MKPEPPKEKSELGKLEDWFATHKTEFDISAIGFHNYIKKYYPHLLKR